MKITSIIAAATIALSAAPSVSAEDFFYRLTRSSDATFSGSWSHSGMPLPDQSVLGEGFAIDNVAGTFPGTTSTLGYVDYFSSANGGGFIISDPNSPTVFISLRGAQLYTGPETAPVMTSGTYFLADTNGQSDYVLTVSSAASSVPEPASWALMILGVGLVGGAVRNRRATIRFA